MATIGTRRNKEGQREITIKDINNDLNGLIDAIDEIRKEQLFTGKIFITEDLKFSNQTFNVIVSNIFPNCVFEGKVNFSFASFNSGIDFSETIFKGHTTFSYTTFKSKVYFIKSTFENIINFDNATFVSDVDFTGSTFSSLSFKDTDCQTVVFNKCSFNLILGFDGSVFHNQINFSHSIFNTPQEFKNIYFMDKANFSNTIFEQEAEFKDCKVDSKTLISFQCATFKKGLDISTSNFNLCKLNFLGIKIENINKALSSYIYNYRENDTKQFLSVPHRFRETFRFIKNSLYVENNQIEGLEFYKKEMEVYGKELESKGDEYWQDKIMLWLNKMSNNYGTSWLRGVGFTAVWALVILGIILGITIFENQDIIPAFYHWGILQQILKAYIEIINIAKWTDIKPLGYELSGFGLFFLFVGRIFIGYGYYQTIQAFRKYGK